MWISLEHKKMSKNIIIPQYKVTNPSCICSNATLFVIHIAHLIRSYPWLSHKNMFFLLTPTVSRHSHHFVAMLEDKRNKQSPTLCTPECLP